MDYIQYKFIGGDSLVQTQENICMTCLSSGGNASLNYAVKRIHPFENAGNI